MHTYGSHSAGRHLWHGGKLQEGADLVRGRRPQQSLPCSFGAASIRQVHDLRAADLPEDEDPGAKRRHHRHRNFRKSLECTSAGGSLADSQVIATEKRQLGKVIAMAQAQSKAPLPVGPAKRAEEESAFQSAKDSKKIALDPSDSTKCVVVGAGLSDK